MIGRCARQRRAALWLLLLAAPAALAAVGGTDAEGGGLIWWLGEVQEAVVYRLNRLLQTLPLYERLTPTVLLPVVGFCLLYGALHVVGPGHGKTVIVSYLGTRDARLWRGLLMAVQISVSHVTGAVLIIVLADVSLRQVMGGTPAAAHWVQLGAYAFIAVLGWTLLVRALLRLRQRREGGGAAAAATCACHGHAHHGSQGLLAVGAGLIPCTGSLFIMAFAMANHMVWVGVGLVALIGVGMACTLSLIAVATVFGRRALVARLSRRSGRLASRLGAGLEVAGFSVVALFGTLLTLVSLPRIG